jgi:two-component system LytT family response regulator/two-component system response regulator AlgR
MLQPLALCHESLAWRNPIDIQETQELLQALLERSTPTRFPVKAGEGWVFLDMRKVTHFEVGHEVVHVWAGQRFRTSWTTLTEVEAAFPREDFVRIQRHILLRPETVLGFKMTWAGRAEVRVHGGQDLEVSRGSVPRLRERLGLG